MNTSYQFTMDQEEEYTAWEKAKREAEEKPVNNFNLLKWMEANKKKAEPLTDKQRRNIDDSCDDFMNNGDL